MNIVVTGGAGFIGSNFIYYLLEKHPNDRIICCDNLCYCGNLCTLSKAFEYANFIFSKTDITDRQAVYKLFEEQKPDVVVNFAAQSHVDRSISNPSVFFKTNIEGTAILLDAALKYGITRFHQVSTDEVYGDLPIDRNDLKFTENSPLIPSSPYSSSKASADLICLSYSRTYGLPVTISRCSNNFGKYQYPEKLIPLTIKNALNNLPINIYGTGDNVRDWLYVEDHCKAIDMIINCGNNGEIYNVGGNNEISNIELVRRILDILKADYSLIHFVEDRKGHDRRYAIDYSKISKQFGYQPSSDQDEKLKDTIQWYKDHQQWTDTIMAKQN